MNDTQSLGTDELTNELTNAPNSLKSIENALELIYAQVLSETDGTFEYGANADNLLVECVNVSHTYLNNESDTDCLPTSYVLKLFEFIVLKLEYLSFLRHKLGIPVTDEVPFVDLMDTVKHLDGLSKSSDEVMYTRLNKDITALSEQLEFSYSVFRKMINERNVFID